MNSHVNVKNEEVNYKVHMTSLGIFFKNNIKNAKYDSELNFYHKRKDWQLITSYTSTIGCCLK